MPRLTLVGVPFPPDRPAPRAYPEDEPIVIEEGPDYPLSHLLDLAAERASDADTMIDLPDEERCPAVVECHRADREFVPGKRRCRKRAAASGYCNMHRHLAAPPQEGAPT